MPILNTEEDLAALLEMEPPTSMLYPTTSTFSRNSTPTSTLKFVPLSLQSNMSSSTYTKGTTALTSSFMRKTEKNRVASMRSKTSLTQDM